MHVVWTKPGCGWCDKAKELLKQYNFEFVEKNALEEFEEFMVLFPNAKTVPQIIFHNEKVGGYEGLKQAFEDQNIFTGGQTF